MTPLCDLRYSEAMIDPKTLLAAQARTRRTGPSLLLAVRAARGAWRRTRNQRMHHLAEDLLPGILETVLERTAVAES
jgi:hypothetical protein